MRVPLRKLTQRLADNCRALLGVNLSVSTWPRRILFDTCQPTLCVTDSPTPGLVTRDAHHSRDLLIVQAISSVQNNRRSLGKANSNTPTTL